MSNTQLRDEAVAQLQKTTITYPEWHKRCQNPAYKSQNTAWGKAFMALDGITDAQPSDRPQPTQPTLLLPQLDQMVHNGISNNPTPAFTMTSDHFGAIYHIYVDDTDLGTITANGRDARFQMPNLDDGLHVIYGEEISPNAGWMLTPVTFQVDTVPPPAPSKPELPSWSNLIHPTFVGTGPPGTLIRISEGASQYGGAVVTDDGKYTVATLLGPGQHTVYAQSVDKAGNVSSPSESLTYGE